MQWILNRHRKISKVDRGGAKSHRGLGKDVCARVEESSQKEKIQKTRVVRKPLIHSRCVEGK